MTVQAGWQPSISPENMAHRAWLLATVRQFFASRDVLEVETPILSAAGNSDPGMEQFGVSATTRQASRWLRTSPEYAMKRLLAHGCGDIYELARVFRAGESGRHHNPEFTLLEWYRRDWNYRQLMQEVVELIDACSTRFGRRWQVRETSYRELVSALTGIDPFTSDLQQLADCAQRHAIAMSDTSGLDTDGWLDVLMSHIVQPALPADQLTLVRDFPASQAALARIRPDDPPVAERFEVFLGPIELANGYQELTDPGEQRRRFNAENDLRKRHGQPRVILDERLLDALGHGLPECAGVALGIDRLLMALSGADHIKQVIAIGFESA